MVPLCQSSSFLSIGQSLWAKDLIFVVSDGYLEGMHAFLSVYHGTESSVMHADPLPLVNGGVIWTALCLDYPGHSFSELGIFYGPSLSSLLALNYELSVVR